MKIKQIERIELLNAVDVYDIEVPDNDNFKLEAGVFVHNSKDISDAVCGLCWLLERTQLNHIGSVQVVNTMPTGLKLVTTSTARTSFTSSRKNYLKQKLF
jgi:hypothetical protein